MTVYYDERFLIGSQTYKCSIHRTWTCLGYGPMNNLMCMYDTAYNDFDVTNSSGRVIQVIKDIKRVGELELEWPPQRIQHREP